MVAPGPSTDGRDLEAKAAFLLRLRARGIRDLDVLRAFEAVPRDAFVPPACAALALRNVALPLACGQTMAEPFVVARMMEALAVTPACRVLEIGTGSGYATAILSRLAGAVVSVERFEALAVAAQARLARLGVAKARIVWGDGGALSPDLGAFDRIVVHAALPEDADLLTDRLAARGILVAARRALAGEPHRQYSVRITRDRGVSTETRLAPSRLGPLLDGVSRAR